MNNEWTPVSTAAPQLDHLVLLYGKGMGVQVGARIAGSPDKREPYRWSLRGGHFGLAYDANVITHWMPLPDSPPASLKVT